MEHEQKKGERRKYYYVSDYARRILVAVEQATEPKPKEKIEKWQINEFLKILQDEKLSNNLRLSYSNGCMHASHPFDEAHTKEENLRQDSHQNAKSNTR